MSATHDLRPILSGYSLDNDGEIGVISISVGHSAADRGWPRYRCRRPAALPGDLGLIPVREGGVRSWYTNPVVAAALAA